MSDELLEEALLPHTEQVVDFYEDSIPVALVGEEAFVPLKMLTDFMGLNWSGQYARIQRNEVLSRHVHKVSITASDGKQYEMLCLALEYLPGWLFGVSTNRVKEELREKLVRYQEECFKVLWRAFQTEIMPGSVPSTSNAPLEQVRDLARQQALLSQQQAELWEQLVGEKRRLSVVQELSEEHDGMIADLEWQLDALRRDLASVQGEMSSKLVTLGNKLRLLPEPSERAISKEQQSTIQGLVGDLVSAANARGIALWQNRGGNNYQAAYATLNRTFRVPSYKDITNEQYPEAIEWLEGEIGKIEGS